MPPAPEVPDVPDVPDVPEVPDPVSSGLPAYPELPAEEPVDPGLVALDGHGDAVVSASDDPELPSSEGP